MGANEYSLQVSSRLLEPFMGYRGPDKRTNAVDGQPENKMSPPIRSGSEDMKSDGVCKKCKGFPYSLPSVGPGADPGVQAVSLQVTDYN